MLPRAGILGDAGSILVEGVLVCLAVSRLDCMATLWGIAVARKCVARPEKGFLFVLPFSTADGIMPHLGGATRQDTNWWCNHVAKDD